MMDWYNSNLYAFSQKIWETFESVKETIWSFFEVAKFLYSPVDYVDWKRDEMVKKYWNKKELIKLVIDYGALQQDSDALKDWSRLEKKTK